MADTICQRQSQSRPFAQNPIPDSSTRCAYKTPKPSMALIPLSVVAYCMRSNAQERRRCQPWPLLGTGLRHQQLLAWRRSFRFHRRPQSRSRTRCGRRRAVHALGRASWALSELLLLLLGRLRGERVAGSRPRRMRGAQEGTELTLWGS